jgi:hypothetical protein
MANTNEGSHYLCQDFNIFPTTVRPSVRYLLAKDGPTQLHLYLLHRLSRGFARADCDADRALTGVGGGGLMTLAQTIVSDVVTLRERSVNFFPPIWCHPC